MSIIMPLRRRVPAVGPAIIPGSQNYLSAGVFSFVIPYFHQITFDVRAGGGGGGGANNTGQEGEYNPAYDGLPGGQSYMLLPGVIQLSAYPGTGGGGYSSFSVVGPPGAHGGTSGNGDGNVTGGGGAGGTQAYWPNMVSGGYPGGYGGRIYKTFAKGALTPRSTVTIVVGGGGAPGPNDFPGMFVNAEYGGSGAIYISWS